MKRSLIILVFLLLALPVWADTHYVATKASIALNQTDEGATAWTNANSISTPTSIKTAFNRAVAGDLVYFRGGTYYLGPNNISSDVSYRGNIEPANSGSSGNPIIFRAYTGEIPILNTISAGTCDHDEVGTNLGILKDYITVDGFKFTATGSAGGSYSGNPVFGRILIGSRSRICTDISILNCEFVGGPVNYGDNAAGFSIIMDTAGTYYTDNILVQNCYFHDYTNVTANDNICAFQSYSAHHMTVEYCTFYHNSTSMYDKQKGSGNIYRYNFFCEGDGLDQFGNSYAKVYTWVCTGELENLTIHHNVFLYEKDCIEFQPHTTSHNVTNVQIYNNTIVHLASSTSGTGCGIIHADLASGSDTCTWYAWNNIFYNLYNGTVRSLAWFYAGHAPQYLNYNHYYKSTGTISWVGTSGCSKTTLTTWKADCSQDANSVETDPGFANVGGLTAVDYKRSSYTANGRGGAYDSVMGAYITGSEQIGYNAAGAGSTSPTYSGGTLSGGSHH